MVSQTSIHLKLNSELLKRLDNICRVSGVNRNMAINKMVDACLFSCELQFERKKRVHFFD